MASKRNLRRRSCEGKRRYETEQAARSAARLCSWMHDADRLTPYRCGFCGSWHFGHRVQRDSRGRAAA